jgi:peptidoglycan glycosyltransferase
VNRPIRRVGYAVTILILVLVAQLTYLQVVDADNLANDPKNVRSTLKEVNRPRGRILTADGQVLADETKTTTDEYKYLRFYPQGDLFAHVVGYQSFGNLVGSTGVEQSENDVLTGQDTSLQLSNLGDVLSGKSQTNNVVLSLTESAQKAARDALGGQKGSVVALDVRTGAVLAMYSNPTYNPNLLSVHDPQAVQDTFNAINSDANDKPALQRAYRDRYPPGSTFKVVTSKSAIETGQATPDSPSFDVTDSFQIPGVAKPLYNFEQETCGGTMEESLVVSCNATFAKLGYEMGDAFPPQMDECGIDNTPPIDLEPPAVESVGPRVGDPRPRFALAGIGQGDVFTSPLQMALIAEGIANNGVIREPHVVKEVQDSDGKVIQTTEPKDWTTCMQPTTAAAVTNMMVDVVDNGTGTAAQIDGVPVAGKTGTAETGVPGEHPHAWFIAFAPANAPRYAVAVIVEHGGVAGGDNATGGAVAAPMAKQVLQDLLATNP